MKPKHFTFDLDYSPIPNSNVFQSIKIQPNIKNCNNKKNGLKRFSVKNELNFQQIPDIMFFQKSIKKPKNIPLENISPSSNQTKKSHTFSYDEIEWSLENKNKQSEQKQKRVESCPKPSQIKESKQSFSFLRNEDHCGDLIDKQKFIQKSNIYPETGYFQRNSHKNSQLESLQECRSEFDESSNNSIVQAKPQSNKTNKVTVQSNNSKSEQNEKKTKKAKCNDSQKHQKSKKTQKSHASMSTQINPENLSSKDRQKPKVCQGQKEKDPTKILNSLLVDEGKNTNNKFICLNRKSYYLIGSKNNKHRSLNKDKKTKNKSTREDGNVILTNGDLTEHSRSIPSSNCRNSSMTSTVNSKVKVQSSKSTKQAAPKQLKLKPQTKINAEMFQIVRKTGQILDKYKVECIQLKKQKDQYQQKYEEALKKLNRIREELEFVMKPA